MSSPQSPKKFRRPLNFLNSIYCPFWIQATSCEKNATGTRSTTCFFRKKHKNFITTIHLIKARSLNPHGHAQVALVFLPIDMVQEVDRILYSN
jgi:hypothetical protein